MLVSSSQAKYWTTDRLEVSGRGPEGPFVVTLDKPFALIGSHPQADISLPGAGVSRRHLYVHVADGRIFAVYLDRDRQRGRFCGTWIDPNEMVRAGRYRLQLGFVDGQPLAAEPDHYLLTESCRQRPFPILQCRSDRAELGRKRLSRRISFLGRASACPLHFPTRSISAEHCLFYRQDDSLWVVHLSRAGETLVNGRPVSCAELHPDDKIELGRVKLTLQMATSDRFAQIDLESEYNDSQEWAEHTPIHEAKKAVEDRSVLASDNSDFDPESSWVRNDHARPEARILQLESEQRELNRLLTERTAELERCQAELTRRLEELHRQEQEFSKAKLLFETQQEASNAAIERLRAAHREAISNLESQLANAQRDVQNAQAQTAKDAAEMECRLAELERRQQAWLEVANQKKEELRAVSERLKRRQQRIGERRDQQREKQEALSQQAESLAEEQRKLEAARQQLAVERKEFERFVKINSTQRNVLTNLGQMHREKSAFYRAFLWLTRPFR